jgi:uncharacterized protein (TIGR03066 family)
MHTMRLVMAGMLVFGLAFTARADDKDDKKTDSVKAKLVGIWQVEKGKGLPRGAKLEFTKDGKALFTRVITTKDDGDKEEKLQGTYKVEGSTIKLTTKRGEKERTQDIKVSKVDDKQLVLEGPKGETLTLKRVGKTGEKKAKE